MSYVLIILLSLLFAGSVYLFVAPFYLEINSSTGLFRIRLHHAASMSLKVEDRIYVETKILGWKKRSAVEFNKKEQEQVEVAKKEVHKDRAIGTRFSGRKLQALIKSFKVNTCRVSIDTGDVQWNGMLYPVFFSLSWYVNKPVEINFVGKNEIVIEIQNSIARMSWALISSN